MLQAALFSEDVARMPGLLQRLDARVKVLALVGLLVAVGLVHNVEVLVAAYLATVVLAAPRRSPLGFFVQRVWLFIPIFTGIIVLPATLNVITPGEIVVPLPFGLGLTRQGLTAAAIITIRVATSISLVLLVTLTTPWARLLAALRALGVPRLFVLVLGMAYRYLFVLLAAVQDMYVARRARAIAPERDHARRPRVRRRHRRRAVRQGARAGGRGAPGDDESRLPRRRAHARPVPRDGRSTSPALRARRPRVLSSLIGGDRVLG